MESNKRKNYLIIALIIILFTGFSIGFCIGNILGDLSHLGEKEPTAHDLLKKAHQILEGN